MPLNIEEEEELIMYMLYISESTKSRLSALSILSVNHECLGFEFFLSLFFLFQTQNDYFSSYIFIGYGYG